MITNMKDKADATLRELTKRFLTDRTSMTDADISKMLHCANLASMDEDDPFDPSKESPIDLYGPWWE